MPLVISFYFHSYCQQQLCDCCYEMTINVRQAGRLSHLFTYALLKLHTHALTLTNADQ